MLNLTENVVKRQIENVLKFYVAVGKVGHYIRLNSGRYKIQGQNKRGVFKTRMIKGAPAGTADIVVFLPIKDKNYSVTLWLEAKRSSGGVHLDSQIAFQKMVCEMPQHYYYVVRSADEVEKLIVHILTKE